MTTPTPDRDVTAADLLAYMGASSGDEAFATAKVAEAVELLAAHVGDAAVPDPVWVGAVLEVGAKLYNRRSSAASAGSVAYGDGGDLVPALPAKDPLVTVYAPLAPYLPGPFA